MKRYNTQHVLEKVLLLVLLMLASTAWADPFYVSTSGSDGNNGLTSGTAFRTIQHALNTAPAGSTVIVLPGTYTGWGNRNLDFSGKALTLVSQGGADVTTIDCQNSSNTRAFHFHSGETADAVVDGFTLTRGNYYQGAAIYCQGSSPTIRNCDIVANSSSNGGAVYCKDLSQAVISHCTIRNNTNTGGVRFDNSACSLINCLLVNNTADIGAGGAIRCDNGYRNPVIRNCTVVDNQTVSNGGGLWCSQTFVTVENCIFWDNQANGLGPQISVNNAFLTVSYSIVAGGQTAIHQAGGSVTWGAGNLNQDPLFGDPVGGDYHLASERGRYLGTPVLWVVDNQTSPGVDGGKPTDSVGPEPNPNGGRINMGAYGGTPQASLSLNEGAGDCFQLDFNSDGVIEIQDLYDLIDAWLAEWSASLLLP